ncbi:Exonuclease DPD1, chloroplastic/mitochondrial [Glycine max]|nr:Exonuclease DPD1, chloroplastic/mitochondrial [Glycine max]
MARGAPNQKVSTIRLSENILANPTVNVNKTQLDQSQQIQYCDIQEIVENKDLSCYTVIVFHNETTGFSRENDKIIEIALGDVQGGKNTTFQTLLSHQQSQLAPFSLISVSGLKAVDFRQLEVLLVKKVHQFEVTKSPLEALVDMGLNGEYNLKELMTLVSLGAEHGREHGE